MNRLISFGIILVLLVSNSKTASVLSWITGSRTTLRPILPAEVGNPASVNFQPEETGECAHWGNVVPAQMADVDMSYHGVGISRPSQNLGSLIGSHKTIPIGSLVAITNMRNGNTVTVRVVPPKTAPVFGRVMDLSPTAFSQLALLSEGAILCSVKVIQAPSIHQADIVAVPSYTLDNRGVIRNPSIPTPILPGSVYDGVRIHARDAEEDASDDPPAPTPPSLLAPVYNYSVVRHY